MRRPDVPTIRALKTSGLILAVLAGMTLCGRGAAAQETGGPPMSLPAVSAAEGPQRISVAELFTSQACAFCPEADAYFHTLIERHSIIGFACHVSYFDADRTSLSQAFCAERQNRYNATLHFGPNFTPQMIVNGSSSFIGYQKEPIEEALIEENAPLALVVYSIQDGAFQFGLPPLGYSARHNVLIALIDRPHRVVPARRGGEPSVHYNVVSALIDAGEWDGSARTLDIKVDFRPENKGFIVLAQNSETLRIVAAGQYLMSGSP